MKEKMYDYTGLSDLEYAKYLHQGTVINVEEFGGYIEIDNCTFL